MLLPGPLPRLASVPLRVRNALCCYARSIRAFCNWLEAEGYVLVAPS
ncbi:MAG TPA: hypothetical protein VIZ18_02860 [Ktedonobacteraceae bacterium]